MNIRENFTMRLFIVTSRAGTMKLFYGCQYKTHPIPGLFVNIRIGRKRQTVTDTLAYYSKEIITLIKTFITQARRKKVIKLFFRHCQSKQTRVS